MHESVSGIVLALFGAVAVTYLALKIQQNRRRLQSMVGVLDAKHRYEMDYLFELADSGQLQPWTPGAAV